MDQFADTRKAILPEPLHVLSIRDSFQELLKRPFSIDYLLTGHEPNILVDKTTGAIVEPSEVTDEQYIELVSNLEELRRDISKLNDEFVDLKARAVLKPTKIVDNGEEPSE